MFHDDGYDDDDDGDGGGCDDGDGDVERNCLTNAAEIGPREDVFQAEQSGFSSVS